MGQSELPAKTGHRCQAREKGGKKYNCCAGKGRENVELLRGILRAHRVTDGLLPPQKAFFYRYKMILHFKSIFVTYINSPV